MGRKDEAYNHIKNLILDNTLLPEVSVRELEIAEELKMSRTPVREALRDLEAEGLVISYPSRGTIVAPLTPYDVEEIYELRALHELWALERSFSRITKQELDYIQQKFDESVKAMDYMVIHQTDRFLHGLIIEKSGSKRLSTFVANLNSQIERIRRINAKNRNRIEIAYQEHLIIINCLRSRDLPRCKEALRTHLRSVTNTAIESAKVLNSRVSMDI